MAKKKKKIRFYKKLIGLTLLAFVLIGLSLLAFSLIQGSANVNFHNASRLNSPSPWDVNHLSPRAETFSISGGKDFPKFVRQLILDPRDVTNGEYQHISVWAKDPLGIKTVQAIIATDQEDQTVNLVLKEGTTQEGRWQGVWRVYSITPNQTYTISLKATNNKGQVTEMTTFFSGKAKPLSLLKSIFIPRAAWAGHSSMCNFSDSGSVSLNSDCYVPEHTKHGINNGSLRISRNLELKKGAILGIEGGDITIDSNRTITMEQDATLIFNQGRSIHVNGYILKTAPNTIIKKGHLTFYRLTVSKSGNGSGTVTSQPLGINCGSTCSRHFISGASVTLSASPASSSNFTGWSGACSGTGSCILTMNSNKSVTANFVKKSYALSVSKTGSGKVRFNPPNYTYSLPRTRTYDYGTSVTLTAYPSTGYNFTGWSGACSGTGSCTVSMTANRSVTANFAVACQCSSGPCCDGCHYRPSNYVCSSTTQTDYGCPWGTGCGADVGKRTRSVKRYCSGSSSSCNGSVTYGSWSSYSVYDNCSSSETCSDNDPTCNYTSSCACQCSSGPCCDGCHYYGSSHVCSSWTDYDYRCSGTGCGADAQRKSRSARRYCSGSSSSCNGSVTYGSWSGWTTIDNCSSNEKCHTNNSTYANCVSDSSCASVYLQTCPFSAPAGIWVKDHNSGWSDTNICSGYTCTNSVTRCRLGTSCHCDAREGGWFHLGDKCKERQIYTSGYNVYASGTSGLYSHRTTFCKTSGLKVSDVTNFPACSFSGGTKGTIYITPVSSTNEGSWYNWRNDKSKWAEIGSGQSHDWGWGDVKVKAYTSWEGECYQPCGAGGVVGIHHCPVQCVVCIVK